MNELNGPVLIVGAGLIGTSVGLALAKHGVATYLRDADERASRLAASLGAGSGDTGVVRPELVVIAVPPDQLATQIATLLKEFPDAFVTDVGSVKTRLLDDLRSRGIRLDRYVGGHPMAGSERSGPLAARADLFEGRAWALVTRPDCNQAAVRAVEAVVGVCGAVAVTLPPEAHDQAVALVSHLPHVAAALVAGQLATAPEEYLGLSGPGVRDVTRIAAGDPALWQQILLANATAVAEVLNRFRDDVDRLLAGLAAGDRPGVAQLLARGAAGARAIPGKHGGIPVATNRIVVAIPDSPGSLAALFAAVSSAGVNVEDVRIDHDPGRPAGHVEVTVAAVHTDAAIKALTAEGWVVER